jgi:hypothetical protein
MIGSCHLCRRDICESKKGGSIFELGKTYQRDGNP